jgi:hypothetical protein
VVAATSIPVLVRYPPLKKCFNSNSPYGVAMYLPVATRDRGQIYADLNGYVLQPQGS